MTPLPYAVRRELRVAFSRRAQPVWFRILKWTCILTGVSLLHDRPWFWWTLAGLAGLGTLVHFLYRRKTRTWTRAWGGWNDLEAGRD
ncbi:MAG: hypothetical protein ABIP06_04050 [Pyrinomonadaceae bacterium]